LEEYECRLYQPISTYSLVENLNKIVSRLVLGPTQPPIQWVPGALSLGVEQPGCEGAIPPLPHYAFVAWCLVKAQGQLYLYHTCLMCEMKEYSKQKLQIFMRYIFRVICAGGAMNKCHTTRGPISARLILFCVSEICGVWESNHCSCTGAHYIQDTPLVIFYTVNHFCET
jgi:hypothetical protein